MRHVPAFFDRKTACSNSLRGHSAIGFTKGKKKNRGKKLRFVCFPLWNDFEVSPQ
jgi:hypothetical protein